MGQATLDDVYSALAEGIDRHGPEKSEMFIAKVALLLANEIGAPQRCLDLISEAESNMDRMRMTPVQNG